MAARRAPARVTTTVVGRIGGCEIYFGADSFVLPEGKSQMADVTFPDNRRTAGRLVTANRLRLAQRLLLAGFLAWGCWAAVNEATAKENCETTLGRLAVRFKLDSYFSNCQCMKPSLDFSDSCNSMYLPLL
jgi:hypothetical protein